MSALLPMLKRFLPMPAVKAPKPEVMTMDRLRRKLGLAFNQNPTLDQMREHGMRVPVMPPAPPCPPPSPVRKCCCCRACE